MLLPALVSICLGLPSSGLQAVEAQPQDPAGGGPRLSLEELLEHYRSSLGQLHRVLRQEATGLVDRVEEAVRAGDPKALQQLRQEIVDLGPEAVPLFLPYLDPGRQAKDPGLTRSRQVTLALGELPVRPITDSLLRLLEAGSSEGRRNALRLLARSEERERVSAVLIRFLERADGELGTDVLLALARMGGEANEAYLARVLGGSDTDRARSALTAIARAAPESMRDAVLSYLKQAEAADVHDLVKYFQACPEAVDEDSCEAFLALAFRVRKSQVQAVLLIDLLADNSKDWSSKLRKSLRSMAELPDGEVALAARIALVKSGDRSAKRDLYAPYDESIERNSNWAQAYFERAVIHYRVANYRAAIKDYTKALQLATSNGRATDEMYLGLARANAQMGKLKEAAKWIERAPLSAQRLESLKAEPVFKELAEHDRYGRVFDI